MNPINLDQIPAPNPQIPPQPLLRRAWSLEIDSTPTFPKAFSRRAKSLDYHHIQSTEISSQTQPDLQQTKSNLQPTKDYYSTRKEYFTVMRNLVKAEANYEKEMINNWIVENAHIQWTLRGNYYRGKLQLSEEQKKQGNITLETKFKIFFGDWTTYAYIDSIEDRVIHITNEKSSKQPPTLSGNFIVKQVFCGVVYFRMTAGLSRFLRPSMYKPISSLILGHAASPLQTSAVQSSIDTSLLATFDLNPSQTKAATEALTSNSPIYLILGPPGTGKTKTSVAIISQLVHHITTQGIKEKILVCGPSNTAVDDLALKLFKAGVKDITRMYSMTKEMNGKMNPELKEITLSNKIRARNTEIQAIQNKIRQNENLTPQEQKQYKALKKGAERTILEESTIVCCTCSAAGDGRLDDIVFKNVFIDEAAQSIEPETLIPLTFGAQKVFFAGDHKQLGPVIKCEEVKRAGLDRALFERLVKDQVSHTMLDVQYRMHPLIAEFPSNNFYQGKLKTDPSVQERHDKEAIPSFKEKPLRFFDTNGREKKSGTSWMNKDEARKVKKNLKDLTKHGVKPEDIGIITPYVGQKELLQKKIHAEKCLKDVKIASVDEFQGGEKGYIIISTVRTNAVGFLNDERRLNVAITRARYGLIICGNSDLLMVDENWKNLIQFYKNNESFVSTLKLQEVFEAPSQNHWKKEKKKDRRKTEKKEKKKGKRKEKDEKEKEEKKEKKRLERRARREKNKAQKDIQQS